MNHRIHFLVAGEDKARYESQAAHVGMSLGAWLREAAEEHYRTSRARDPFRTPEQLGVFFTACDERETAAEPDWADQRRVLASSRVEGLTPT
ncbi:MAG: hypothetical protein RLN75_03290 [Longimicrobiales bacterium]